MMSITLAIANQIDRIVPNATIYIEKIEQMFEEPSFYVYEINTTSKDEIMDQQTRKHMYCVTFFPDSKNETIGIKEQCENMRNKLLDEFLFLDDLSIKLLDREAKTGQEELVFTFVVKYRVRKVETVSKIQTLEQTGGLKRG